MVLGDSKSVPVPAFWGTALLTALGPGWAAHNSAVAGTNIRSEAPIIAAKLATMPNRPTTDEVRVLLNWGANDLNDPPAEATWEANYLTILDACHAKWPTARLYVTRPWRQGFDANADLYATRIGHLVTARPGIVFLGPDERLVLKGSDNGVSETTDGVHYSALGHAGMAAAWIAVLQ